MHHPLGRFHVLCPHRHNAGTSLLKPSFAQKLRSLFMLFPSCTNKSIHLPAGCIHRVIQHFQQLIAAVSGCSEGHWSAPHPLAPEVRRGVPAVILLHCDDLALDDHRRDPVERELDIGHLCAIRIHIGCLYHKLLERIESFGRKTSHRFQKQSAAAAGGIYQDAMFDTKGKAFSGAKIPKKT